MVKKNGKVRVQSSIIRISMANRAVLYADEQSKHEEFSYEDLERSCAAVVDALQCIFDDTIKPDCIAIVMGHSPIIVPTILGIKQIGATFSCVGPITNVKDLDMSLTKIEANCVVSDERLERLQLLKQINIMNRTLYIQNASVQFPQKSSNSVAYKVQTSGSTGASKVVEVPFQCLMANVRTLSNILHLAPEDVIFSSAPPTFDPFLLDVFLALENKATIMLAHNNLRLSASALLKVLFPLDKKKCVTVMQMTPSMFRRWSLDEIKASVLSPESSLKSLLLGGEAFPSIDEVTEWQDWETARRKRVFNIYGLTEISCWSTIYEVSHEDIIAKREIPLGTSLDKDSSINVMDDKGDFIQSGKGELVIINKSRICSIEGIRCTEVKTKDYVEFKEDGLLFYRGRLNNIIKRFGNQLNLETIKKHALKCHGVQNASCLYIEELQAVILVINPAGIQSEAKRLMKTLKKSLQKNEVPTDIMFLDEFPLNVNGKIDTSELTSLWKKQCGERSLIDRFVERINNSLNVNIVLDNMHNREGSKRSKTDISSSFVALGGTSFMALAITLEIEDTIGKAVKELMPMLLNDAVPIRDLCAFIKELSNLPSLSHRCSINIQQPARNMLKMLWSHNMDKCIDATPAILNHSKLGKIVSVGSHSKRLINVKLASGKIQSELLLPDRIEGKVVQLNDQTAISGSYDGFLYCFDFKLGTIKWKFNSNAMIKSRVLLTKEYVILGNYNSQQNLYCLNHDGKLIWSKLIGTKSIFSSPIKFCKKTMIVCTLDGTCTRINISTGRIMWSKKYSSPIFSTPALHKQSETIILAEVSGNLHFLDCNGVQSRESIRISANIFSSIELDVDTFYFGCHDSCVYSYKLEDDLQVEIIFKLECQSQIFATPKLVAERNQLLVSTTNGHLNLICLKQHCILETLRIDGEIFSSPEYCNGCTLIGCRNNFLYCIGMD